MPYCGGCGSSYQRKDKWEEHFRKDKLLQPSIASGYIPNPCYNQPKHYPKIFHNDKDEAKRLFVHLLSIEMDLGWDLLQINGSQDLSPTFWRRSSVESVGNMVTGSQNCTIDYIVQFLLQTPFLLCPQIFWLNQPQMGPLGRENFYFINSSGGPLCVRRSQI